MAQDTIDISNLKRTLPKDNQNNLYDIFVQSFRTSFDFQLSVFFVTRKYEMRLDLIMTDLYDDIEYIGFIMKINDLLNPFSIKLGDVLFYVPQNRITDGTFVDIKNLQNQRDELVNALKTITTDQARADFLNNIAQPTKLPPTISTGNASKIVIDNNNIKIAPDLFINPNTNTNIGDIKDDSGLGNTFDGRTPDNAGSRAPSLNEPDNIERVLVSRFIRSGNQIIDENNENN